MFVSRAINLPALLKKKSHFFFGPRGSGKSHLVRTTLQPLPGVQTIDLLSTEIYARLLRRPGELNEMVAHDTSLMVIDEIQKIPILLDEVHKLIEERRIKFLLTGSSARKLKRGNANLLGGRAWEAHLFPLTSYELGEAFDLLKYLNTGGLPEIYLSQHPELELKNYLTVYLKEEIQAEAIVKRLDHFVRFLDCAALANGEELNFEGISNDSGVPSRSVSSYFEILEDTLLGFQVPAFTATKKRKAIKKSKFYLFDVGVAGACVKRGPVLNRAESFGRALEHFIGQELRAFLSYSGHEAPLSYWRSTSQLEVDFIIPSEFALEVKATDRVSDKHLKGLRALIEERSCKRFVIVSNDPIERRIGKIESMPIATFLKRLWAGELIR